LLNVSLLRIQIYCFSKLIRKPCLKWCFHVLREMFTVSKNIPNKVVGSNVVYTLCLFMPDLCSNSFTTSDHHIEWFINEEWIGEGIDGSGRVCFGIVTAVTMESVAFWVVNPYRSETVRRLVGTYLLHIQDWSLSSACRLLLLVLLLDLLFDPEDRGDVFLRNVRLSTNLKALQPTRPHCSQLSWFHFRQYLGIAWRDCQKLGRTSG
jgi:hypothetical protein